MWPLGFPCWRTLIADLYLFHTNTCTWIIGTVSSDKPWHLRTIFFSSVFHQFVQFSYVLGLNLGLPLNITNFFFFLGHFSSNLWIRSNELGSLVESAWAWPSPKRMPQVPFFAVLSNLFKHKFVFALIFVVLGFLLFLMLKVTCLSQMSLPLWCCNTIS